MKKVLTALVFTLVISGPALAADRYYDYRGYETPHDYRHPVYNHPAYREDEYAHHYHRPYYVYQPEQPVYAAPLYQQPGINVDFSL